MGETISVRWIGKIGYHEAWSLQKKLVEERLAGEIPDTLLLLEHPPTFTLGRSAKKEHLLSPVEDLERDGFAVVETDRGGDVTYHGEGQLVGYPIVNLREAPHHADMHRYLRDIEETLIRTLGKLGVVGERFPGYTGVWVDRATPTPRKIAAIGVKASRWITLHGFALNVCPNLEHFTRITPCGIQDYGVTSLELVTGRAWSVEAILPAVAESFQEAFGYTSFEWNVS